MVINKMSTKGLESNAAKLNSFSCSASFNFCCAMISFCLTINSFNCCWISLSCPSCKRTFSNSFEIPVSCFLRLLFSTKISSTLLTELLNCCWSSTNLLPWSVLIAFNSCCNSFLASSTSALRAWVTCVCAELISAWVSVPFFFFSHSSSSCSERCLANCGFTRLISAKVGIFKYEPLCMWFKFCSKNELGFLLYKACITW